MEGWEVKTQELGRKLEEVTARYVELEKEGKAISEGKKAQEKVLERYGAQCEEIRRRIEVNKQMSADARIELRNLLPRHAPAPAPEAPPAPIVPMPTKTAPKKKKEIEYPAADIRYRNKKEVVRTR